MKNTFSVLFFVAVSTMLCAQSSPAIGDPAPPLYIREWIKGGPVTEFEKDHVYVVEFTAVSCPPCRKAIPYLAQLARQYANEVTVLSIYTLESNKRDTTDLRYLTKIHKLVNALDSLFIFPVAADVPQQRSAIVWGITGTPTMFVVDKQTRIAWMGYNSLILDSVIPQVLDNSFNKQLEELRQKEFYSYLKNTLRLGKQGQYREAEIKLDSLIMVYPEHEATLYTSKFKLLAESDTTKAYQLLRTILNSNIEGFVWDKFVSDTWTYPAKPNYDLALQTADRAIAETGADHVTVTRMLMEKAAILRHRSWEPPRETSKKYLLPAAENMRKAMEQSKLSNDEELIERVQNVLHHYEFLSLAVTDERKADKYLKGMYESKLTQVDWSNIINDATIIQKNPNYSLLLTIVDFLVENAECERNTYKHIHTLGWKAKLLALKGHKRKAIQVYHEVIMLCKEAGNSRMQAEYENKVIELEEES